MYEITLFPFCEVGEKLVIILISGRRSRISRSSEVGLSSSLLPMAQTHFDVDIVRLFPRGKSKAVAHAGPRKARSPMLFSYQAISSLFDRPQKDAAGRLGISLTTLKQVCRKLGVLRWPYTRGSSASVRVRGGGAGSNGRPGRANLAKAEESESDNSDDSNVSAETTHAEGPCHHNLDDEVFSYQHHLDAAVFSPMKASDDMEAQELGTLDVVASATGEPKGNKKTHDREVEGTDLSYLVGDPDYLETVWWRQVQHSYATSAAAKQPSVALSGLELADSEEPIFRRQDWRAVQDPVAMNLPRNLLKGLLRRTSEMPSVNVGTKSEEKLSTQ